jgi:ribosomal protein S18 acetylase RimI-like enzyme
MLPAMRWILGRPQHPASDAQATEFLRLAFHRGIDPAELWIATSGDQLIWAVLPIPSPGRTVLLFMPADYSDDLQRRAAIELTERVLQHYIDRNTQLAQALFESFDQRMIDLFVSLQFRRLAELVYLQGVPRKGYAFPKLPAGMQWMTYSEQTHSLFAAAIQQSYAQSLDCPGLAGMRSIEDVIAGHKGVGEFDPATWFVLLEQNNPVGVALVTALPAHQTMELVYLGLIPSARGRGLGEILFRQVLASTAHSAFGRINFAVDGSNRPALTLYYRHGMQRVASKIAMLRDLRK